MPYEFHYRRHVEFAETDMAGIMHFSNYFRFMESAEHAFFRSMGLVVFEPRTADSIAWPRVHVACTYRRAVNFGDTLDIHVIVLEKRRGSFRLGYVMRRGDEDVAYGTARVASAQFQDGRLRSIPMPAEVDAMLEEAPEALRATVRMSE